MQAKGKKIAIWAGWIISLVFIVWAFMSMDLAKVYASLMMADWRWIIPAGILNFIILAIRAARWKVFIEPLKETGYMPVFSSLCIGYMANMLLPARAGEVVRALILAEQTKIPKGSAFGTVVIERVFDGLCTVVLLIAVFLLITPTADGAQTFANIKMAGMSASAVFILVFVAIYLFHKQVAPVVWILAKVTSVAPGALSAKIRDTLESLRRGLDSIDHGHRLLRIALWSVPAWGLAIPFNDLIFQSFGLGLPWEAGLLVLMTQVFGLMAPSGPGFVGVYHAATMAGLMFYGVDREKALSVAVLMHLVVFTMQTIPGFFFMWRLSYSLAEIKKREEEAEQEGLEQETKVDAKASE